MNNEEFQKLVLAEFKAIREEMNERFNNVDNRFNDVESQLDENTQLVKAILHNQEYANAEINALKTTTATAIALKEVKEEVQDAKAGIDTLNNRLFTQEKEISKLKLVK